MTTPIFRPSRRALLVSVPMLLAPGLLRAAAPDDPRLDSLWRCLGSECPGYIYDPRLGEPAWENPPLTPFEELPDDWSCPRCGAGKLEFHRFSRQV